MFCSDCGKALVEREKFCTGCGRVVERSAGFWKRFFAFLLDFAVLQGIGFVVGAGLGLVLGALDPQAFESEAAVQATQARLLPLLIVLVQGCFWLYCATMESQKQATLGKLALGIRVTDLQGGRLSFARATARHFAKLLALLPVGLGFFMVAFTDRKQGLHDLMAQCLVVTR
jgi:uncharacterized RDD family membrane protein YckC